MHFQIIWKYLEKSSSPEFGLLIILLRMSSNIYLTPHTKINLIQITDLSIKSITIKIPEQNLRENLHDLAVHTDSLDSMGRTNNSIKTDRKTWIDTSQSETYEWPIKRCRLSFNQEMEIKIIMQYYHHIPISTYKTKRWANTRKLDTKDAFYIIPFIGSLAFAGFQSKTSPLLWSRGHFLSVLLIALSYLMRPMCEFLCACVTTHLKYMTVCLCKSKYPIF